MSFFSKFIVNDKNFYKKVLTIAIPIALQSLITIGVNMLDTIMLGALGETELSATSLANSFISIYHIFCMGIGMGASVLISRYWGMKSTDPEKAEISLKKAISIMLKITIVLALIHLTLDQEMLIRNSSSISAKMILIGLLKKS